MKFSKFNGLATNLSTRRQLCYLLFFLLSAAFQPIFHNISEVDNFSNKLFIDSVNHYSKYGDDDVGGFMTAFDQNIHIATVKIIDKGRERRKIYPYVSNFNFQYFLGKLLTFGKPSWVTFAVFSMSIFSFMAMAIIAAGISTFAENTFGRRSGYAVALIFGLSPMMIARALSPYWMIFLSFLPFYTMLIFYPKASDLKRFLALAALVGVCFGLKALTGYEYLSNIALGAALPIVYFEFTASGGRFTPNVLMRVLKRSLILGSFIVIAFISAASIHIIKAAIFFGSLYKGVEAIIIPMTYSTIGTTIGIRSDMHITPETIISVAYITLFCKNFIITVPLYFGIILSSILVLARHRWSFKCFWASIEPAQRALIITMLAAVPVSTSWVLLAQRHSVVHPHINWVLGYLFLHIFAAMQLGLNLTLLASRETRTICGLNAGEVRSAESAIDGNR